MSHTTACNPIKEPAPAARALRATRYRKGEEFARAAGTVLAFCRQQLGACCGFVIETTADRGSAWAGVDGNGQVLTDDSLARAAEPVVDRWTSALIDGGTADNASVLARPFVLSGRTVGVVLFCWDTPRRALRPDDAGGCFVSLVEACADWVSAEWTRRVEARRDRELAEQRFRAIAEGATDGIFEWNLVSNEVDYSGRWKQMLGYPTDQELTDPADWFNLIDSSDLAQLEADLAMCLAGQTANLRNEHRMTDAEGQTRWMLCRGELVVDDDGEPLRLIGSLSDTTEFKLAEQQLRRAAEHDKLTDLPNRTTLHGKLEQAIRRHRLTGGRRKFALMFLDFDRFKFVNDSLGHDAGDQLLIHIAERLRQQVRLTDTPARLGGDEFVVLLEEVDDLDAVLRVADRLIETFNEPFQIAGNEVRSTASIGIVDGSAGYTDAEAVIHDADLAMYEAKRLGKARYAIFDQDMQDESLKRLVLEKELRHAIGTDQLYLVYQPVVDLMSGTVYGFEALARWQHPEMGLVRPDHFIKVAEETGLILPLGEWVLARACTDLRKMQATNPGPPLTMNINLSRRQVVNPGMAERVRQIVDASGVAAEQITLEITESVIMDARESVAPVLDELRGAGFRLAMDDFGTGHSSLSCLHLFPIDVLKIDRSFVASLDRYVEFVAVIQAVVTLAHTLGLSVVAEGIETQDQLETLREFDCDYLQGYLFAKPMPLAQATAYLSDASGQRRSA
jgi:diguanylate cyclase (GGDEF)-like protein/PAS domain S-box-containing protein